MGVTTGNVVIRAASRVIDPHARLARPAPGPGIRITEKGVQVTDGRSVRPLPAPTLRQMIVLYYLDKWIKANGGRSPSFRELAEAALCKSTRTVHEHVHSLRRKGLVVNLPLEARTIYLTDAGEKALKRWAIPANLVHIKLV